MTSVEALSVAAQLDEDHLPETNGRMAICRRCGSHTDTPQGSRHAPEERQLARANTWLDMERRAKRISETRRLLRN
jgi:hypothetical protein